MAGPNYYEIGAYQIQQQPPQPDAADHGVRLRHLGSHGQLSRPDDRGAEGRAHQVKWTNHLPMTHILDYAIDPTIPRAMTTTGVPITTHVHGAGGRAPERRRADDLVHARISLRPGPDFSKQVRTYVNTQLASTIWYHDHAFGYTRHNVYAGLAGYYIVTDPGNEPAGLPAAPTTTWGSASRTACSPRQDSSGTRTRGDHDPSDLGIRVLRQRDRGERQVWPYLNVEPRKYRFRFLNGSQARFYSLALADPVTSAPGPAFYRSPPTAVTSPSRW